MGTEERCQSGGLPQRLLCLQLTEVKTSFQHCPDEDNINKSRWPTQATGFFPRLLRKKRIGHWFKKKEIEHRGKYL